MSEAAGALRDETMIINMGPQHPSTHGVLRLVLELDGETVVSCRPVIGYLHTGIEKNCEYRTWQQGVTFVTRADYLSNFFEELAYCLAVERLLGIEAPARAKVIRVLTCEMQRIASHLVWLATTGLELGAISIMLYGFRERELLMAIFEAITGLRMNYAYHRIGGLSMDLPDGAVAKIRDFLRVMPGRIDEYEELLTGNPIWHQRTVGIGYLAKGSRGTCGRPCPTRGTSSTSSMSPRGLRATRSRATRSGWRRCGSRFGSSASASIAWNPDR
jgi:NADH-quinone oxidoreductase subunit D